jgi:hypothetical protein
MKLQLGTIYINRTKQYIVPILTEHGKTFEKKVSNLFKLAIGLGDFALIEMGMVIEDSLFILIDTKFSRVHFKETLQWIKVQPYYKHDYPFDDVHTGHLHMIVVEVPQKFKNTLKEFQEGRYSSMYEYDDIVKLFKQRQEELMVLTKDPEMLITFVNKVNKMFKTNISSEGFKGELDFTLKDEDEYFNTEFYNLKNKK